MIRVSQWQTYTFDATTASGRGRTSSFYRFNSQSEAAAEDDSHSDEEAGFPFSRFTHRRNRTGSHHEVEEPHLSGDDLWDADPVCHDVTRAGYILAPDPGGHGGYDVTGCPGGENDESGHHHRRTSSVDFSVLAAHDANEVETLAIKERLHGYVRPTPHL